MKSTVLSREDIDFLLHDWLKVGDLQVATFVAPMFEGRFFGTMCLSEPHAGSSLADATTTGATPGAFHDDKRDAARFVRYELPHTDHYLEVVRGGADLLLDLRKELL